MNCKKQRGLRRIRLVLILLEVLLLGLTAVSGVFAFRKQPDVPEDVIPAWTAMAETEPMTEGVPTEAQPTVWEAPTEEPTQATIGEAPTEEPAQPTVWETSETAPPLTEPGKDGMEAHEDSPLPAETEPAGLQSLRSPGPRQGLPGRDEAHGEDIRPREETLPGRMNPEENPAEFRFPEEIMPADGNTEETAASRSEKLEAPNLPWKGIFFASLLLLAGNGGAILLLTDRIRKSEAGRQTLPARETLKMFPTTALTPKKSPSVGTLHRIGARQYQQDSMGHCAVMGGQGLLAVVADGMGGLSNGEKVSQQIVMEALAMGQKLRPGQENGALYRILSQITQDVNNALGADGLYKSGSTMVAVLVSGNRFHWISVGDSRIYLYREGYISQLNRDHDLLQEWMPEILEGRRSMEQALRDPNGRKVTSFIGMGQLKYVDGSRQSIDIQPGDRILLMTDGVYGSLPEGQMAEILKACPDVRRAAQEMDRRIQLLRSPGQDNYTAMILGF